MSRLGLQGRLLIAVTILGVLLAGVFSVLVWSIAEYRTAVERSTVSQRALGNANRIEVLVLDLETASHELVLTGQEESLEAWERARRDLPAVLARFRAIEHQPEDLGLVRQTIQAVTSYVQAWSVPLVAIARADRTRARRLIASGEGERRFDASRAVIQRFRAQELPEAPALREDANRLGRAAIASGFTGPGGSVLLVALLFGYLRRAVVTPMRRLTEATGRLASGDLSARVAQTGRGDEVGRLGAAFNIMAGSLQESRDGSRTRTPSWRHSRPSWSTP